MRVFEEQVVAKGGVQVPQSAAAGLLAQSDGSGNLSWAVPNASQINNAADKSSAVQQNFGAGVGAPIFNAAGLSSSVTAFSAYVGGTASGPPTSGSFLVGDWIVDQTGKRWTCTVAGTPGTWTQEPGLGSSVTSVFGRTGAIVASTGDYTAAQVTSAADKSSASQQNYNSGVGAPYIAPSGITGATAAVRLVGGTTSGAPTTGTFSVGDAVISQNGVFWICTTAGSPGTWTNAGSASSAVSSVFGRTGAIVAATGDYTAAQVTNAADKSSASQQLFTGEVKAPDFSTSGLTGATNAARFVGGTASGAPTSGTFSAGDFVVDATGRMWVCITGGSPGTWMSSGSSGPLISSQSAAFTATPGQYYLVTAAVTVTLPSAPAASSTIGIRASGATVTIAAGGTDHIGQYGVTTLTTITVPSASFVTLKYLSGIWYVLEDSRPITYNTLSSAYLSANVTTTLGTAGGSYHKFNVNATNVDPGACWDTATNHRYNCPYPGTYEVSGMIQAASGGDSGKNLYMVIYKTGLQVGWAWGTPMYGVSDSSVSQLSPVPIVCAANDYLELWYWNDSVTSAFVIGGGNANNYINIKRIA